MSFVKTNISPLHKKRFATYLGMSLSNPSLPEAIKNAFWMYYIPDENETYVLNDRKEAAFFGLTLMCALNDFELKDKDAFETRLKLLMNEGTESNKRRLNAIFMSNMTTTAEYVETLGHVIKRDEMLKHIKGIDINKLIYDLIGLGNVYQSAKIKQRWASKIYTIDERN